MWKHTNPITQDIEQDCQEIIENLGSHQSNLLDKHKQIKEMKEQKTRTKDLGLRGEIDNLIRKMEAINRREVDLIPDMTQVRALHKQKKKYERLKMEIPGELMNKLVEKVLNVKTEQLKAKREVEDILDDYEAIQNNYLKNPLKSASRSILKRPTLLNTGGKNESRNNMLKNPGSGDGLSFSTGITLENSRKNPKMFTDYLKNYETELSKSLLVMEPGTLEFQKRMAELSKISEMKNSFMEYDMKEQLMKQRGLDEGEKIRKKRMRQLDPDNVGNRLKLINDGTMNNVEKTRMDNEIIRNLENRMVRMDETVRGMEDLVREKEKLASLQRQKYEIIERERHNVEIERIRADRERAEGDHLKRLQRMNNELDYVEQMKLKTMKVLSTQLKSFSKIQEDRWKKRKEAEKQYQKEKLLDIQKEFILREKTRQAKFDSYMLRLEEKMGMALNMIDKDKEEKLRRNMNAQIGNKELQDIFGVGEDFHDKKYQDQLERLAAGYKDLDDKNIKNDDVKERKSIISKKSKKLKKSKKSKKNKSKKSVSRRQSNLTVSSLKTKIDDNEADPDSIFVFIKQISNLPENCTLTLLISALVDINGDIVYDLGQTLPDFSSDSLNPKFNKKFKIPINLLEQGEVFLYCEIKTLDDAISDLPTAIYGSVVFPITEVEKSIRSPIFFESYNEEIINDFKNKKLEVHLGSFMALTIGKGKVNQSTSFKYPESLKTKSQRLTRKFLRKRNPEILKNKMEVIIEEREAMNEDDLINILKQDDEHVKWVAQRYFISNSKLKSKIIVKPIGFILLPTESNLEVEEVMFTRCYKNPDQDGINRKTHIFKNIKWDSRERFQLFDEGEIEFEYKDINKNSTLIFEVLSSTVENGKMELKDIGISAIPLMDNLENATFGLYLLPVFDQTVNKTTLEFFGQKNGLEMLERMYTDENVFVESKFLVVRISDEVRSNLFRDYFRFDKYSYDFVLDIEDDMFSIDKMEDMLNTGRKLIELDVAGHKDEIFAGIQDFCDENPIFFE